MGSRRAVGVPGGAQVLPSALGLMGPRGSRPLANTTLSNSFPAQPFEEGP